MKNIIEALNWRYATKQFDTEKKLSAEQLDMLLEAMRLAPSSFGLQPWKFVVVTNPEIRAKLKEAGYGQAQIAEASHLFVFAVPKVLDDAFVDRFVRSISETRGVPVANLKEYEDMMKGALAMRTPEGRKEWAARQAYIALGVLVAAAATEGIDVGPMEGFDPAKFDEILGLDAMGLETKVIAAVGFRKPDEPLASWPKVRYGKDELVLEIA